MSDGIIAPGFEPEALEILKAKKGGKYIVLQADAAFDPPAMEERTIFGAKLKQGRVLEPVGPETLSKVVTAQKDLVLTLTLTLTRTLTLTLTLTSPRWSPPRRT